MSNMRIYDAVKDTPAEAKKTIKGGRMSGKTDINPMYRIRKLTEQFGPCGIGWYFVADRQWTEQIGEETMCFVNISLYIKVDGEWSKPIFGTGGNMLGTKESKGLYASDEGYKMATTDAISVACKHLGIGADVYWEAGESKYTKGESPAQNDMPRTPAAAPSRRTRINELCERHKASMTLFGEFLSDLQRDGKVPQKTIKDMTDVEFDAVLQLVDRALVSTSK